MGTFAADTTSVWLRSEEPLLAIDEKRRVVVWNEAAERLAGVRGAGARGRAGRRGPGGGRVPPPPRALEGNRAQSHPPPAAGPGLPLPPRGRRQGATPRPDLGAWPER